MMLSCGVLVVSCGAVAAAASTQQDTVRYRAEWVRDVASSRISIPRGLAVTSDCDVWVADPAVGILRFSCSGKELPDIGRQGSGPGEWRYVWHLASRADPPGVLLYDPRLLRLTVFDESGSPITSEQLTFSPESFGQLRGLGWNDGHLVIWTVDKPGTPRRTTEDRSYVWRFGAPGSSPDSVIGMPGPEYVFRRDARNTAAIEAPFGARPVVIVGPDAVIVANTRQRQLLRYRNLLAEPERVSLEVTAEPVRAMDRESYAAHTRGKLFHELEQMRFGPELREYFTEKFNGLLADVTFPATKGAFEMLVPGAGAQLWGLAGCAWGRETCRWRVFDGISGRVTRYVIVPHGGLVVAAAIHGEALFTIEYDAAQTPSVVKYVRVHS